MTGASQRNRQVPEVDATASTNESLQVPSASQTERPDGIQTIYPRRRSDYTSATEIPKCRRLRSRSSPTKFGQLQFRALKGKLFARVGTKRLGNDR
jgi:hypothetical protein